MDLFLCNCINYPKNILKNIYSVTQNSKSKPENTLKWKISHKLLFARYVLQILKCKLYWKTGSFLYYIKQWVKSVATKVQNLPSSGTNQASLIWLPKAQNIQSDWVGAACALISLSHYSYVTVASMLGWIPEISRHVQTAQLLLWTQSKSWRMFYQRKRKGRHWKETKENIVRSMLENYQVMHRI